VLFTVVAPDRRFFFKQSVFSKPNLMGMRNFRDTSTLTEHELPSDGTAPSESITSKIKAPPRA
jgi:hypothetical protein